MRIAVMAVLVLGLATSGSAATYFIDYAQGNDTTGQGTLASPWQTMTKAEAMATGGDTVYLRAGTYPKYVANKLYTPVRTDYLTWKAFPGESVTVEGLDIGRHWTQPTFAGYTCYMIFDGLHIHETTTDKGSAVSLAGARYVKLLDCTIHGFRDHEAGTSSDFVIYSRENRDIYIDGCDLSEAHFGVALWGWDMTLRRSKVHGAHEDAVRIVNCINGLVEDCEIYDVGEGDDLHNDGIQWFSTASGDNAQRVPCQNITIRRCHIHDIEDQDILGNTAPFGLHTNFLFENLLLEQTPSVAWELNIGDTQAVVRNCTIEGAFRFMPNGVGDVRNCIAGTMSWESNTTKVYQDYNCFNQVQGNTAGEHDLIGLSPKYADAAGGDFSLAPDSPCIDTGLSTNSAWTDFNQLRRIDVVGVENQGGGDTPYFDMGAFEYQAASGGLRRATLTVASEGLGTGSGWVTVTAEGYWEATLREDTGGGLAAFYDLTTDPGRTVNLSATGAAGRRLLDAEYFAAPLFSDSPPARTLSIVSSTEQTVVVRATGTHPAGPGVHLPVSAYFTLNAPVYEGSFIDLDVFLENDTAAPVDAAGQTLNLHLPSAAEFDWRGTCSLLGETSDRWVQAAVGGAATAANVARGRSFRTTELTFAGVAAAPDLWPPDLSVSGPSERVIAPGGILYDHVVLSTNLAAQPSLFVTENNIGTGSGTVTVTCPGYYEFILDEAGGSGIRYFYDLRVDPFRKVNLADVTWYNSRLFDMRVHYNQNLHSSNATNRLSVVSATAGQVVVRSTGVVQVGGYPIDTQSDYTFAPPTTTGTNVAIAVRLANNNGLTVGVSSSDFVHLRVAADPTGSTFDWQGSVDSVADNHWLRAEAGPAATVLPLSTGVSVQLQEFSYGSSSQTDATPNGLSFKFGTPAYAVGEVRTRNFLLSTGVAAPAPTADLTVEAALDFSWVYPNTPTTTQNRHQSVLTVNITSGGIEGETYTLWIAENHGPIVDFQVGQPAAIVPGEAAAVNVLGGPRLASTPGAYMLNVTVTGATWGQMATADVPLTLRLLGDIDGDGLVNSADKLEMNKKLNGLDTLPGITLRALDLSGDGALVNAEDKLAINQVLNGLVVP